MPDEDREKLRQECHTDLMVLLIGGELLKDGVSTPENR